MSNPIPPSEDHTTGPDALTIPDVQEVSPPLLTPSSAPADADELLYIESDVDDADAVATPFISPFQMSNGIPTVPSGSEQTPPHAPPVSPQTQTTPHRRRLPLPLVVLLISVVIILAMLGMNAFAQAGSFQHPGTGMAGAPATPLATLPPHPTPIPTHTGKSMPPTPVPMPSPQTPGQGIPTIDWVPAQLPAGWMAAGLAMSDALEAERTAFSFTDREMSLDYRSIGTRTQHSGTMTAATFLLTSAAKTRFLHNDVRMINNTLFDLVRSTRLIRTVINASPSLVQYATQGHQQFAWVDVAFSYWMSQVDPTTGIQTDGRESDPGSGLPRVHHLIVLLLRIPPLAQGTNPAMGGTGWLVSTYSLDQHAGILPTIVQPA